jgi:hypothetical protein
MCSQATTPRAKRVRLTDGRVKRWMTMQSEITSEWSRAIRDQMPTQAHFARVSEWIRNADLTLEMKRDLASRNWGARDLVERTHAEWVLYYDGKRTTSEERATLYTSDAHKLLRGRFEWRGTGKPFFDNAEPALLWGQS